MIENNLAVASDADLIGYFTDAAKKLGIAVLDSDNHDANRIYQYMRSIDFELRQRGQNARMKLAPLLTDNDRFVRYYAAQKLIGLIPGPARAVLEWNYRHGSDALAGDAGMLLAALDSGEYKPD